MKAFKEALADRRNQLKNPDASPIYEWELLLNSGKYVNMATVALALLGICGSEACVERSFSIQGDAHRKVRNRAHALTIEAEMVIRWNSQFLTPALEQRSFEAAKPVLLEPPVSCLVPSSS